MCYDADMGCDHLNLNGAAGTLVRLPNSCGSIPFAVVTRQWVHKNQSIPHDKRSLIKRGTNPAVMGINLATDFAAVDPEANGNVTLFLQGSSIPGIASNFTITPPADPAGLTKRDASNWVGGTLQKLFLNFDKNITGSSPLRLFIHRLPNRANRFISSD